MIGLRASRRRVAARHTAAARHSRRRLRQQGPVPGRLPVLSALAVTALPGLLFGSSFGSGVPSEVLVPVLAVAAAGYGYSEAARVWPQLRPLRAALTALLGLLAIVETTLRATTAAGVPTESSARALYHGIRRSWLLTLQSTAPARPDPQLVVFVPILVLLALVVAMQILHNTGARLPVLLPGFVVGVIAQAFDALPSSASATLVLIWGAAAVPLLAPPSQLRGRVAAVFVIAAAPVALLGGLAAASSDPANRPTYSARDHVVLPPAPVSVVSPLDEIAFRLEHPDVAVFSAQGSTGTDRWQLAVLDRFDGVNWTSGGRLRYLGAKLTAPMPSAVPTVRHDATVLVDQLPGPFLPSQRGLEEVSGLDPLVDERSGTILATKVSPLLRYRLSWAAPQLGADELTSAVLTPHASEPAVTSGPVPEGIVTIARRAVQGSGSPTLRTALKIEKFLRDNYKQASGSDLPSGHGWPQLVHFLAAPGGPDSGSPDSVRRGTSEQFAAAYVVLARVVGIPARLVVGFRQPSRPDADGSYVVRNGDTLAWPEVAVRGIGWVPMDPMGAQGSAGEQDTGGNSTPLGRATQRARSQLPNDPPPPDTGPAPPGPAASGSSSTGWLRVILAVLLAAVAFASLGVLGIPTSKLARAAVRRRRAGGAGVIAAWLEIRDLLRDHGVNVDTSMTVRNVARASADLIDPHAQRAVAHLADLLDATLWSGATVGNRAAESAWLSADIVRTSLARRPVRFRVGAGLAVRGLRPVPFYPP
ncbi:MAG: transglutaminase [Pseudonocardiales bacterium]|nr:MAG: transglutaminase [Pseudonocardiales bacterium]